MPPPMATSGAGECGHSFSMRISTANVPSATTSVEHRRLGNVPHDAQHIAEEPCLVMWIPRSFGN
jgi:hypothetical protein